MCGASGIPKELFQFGFILRAWKDEFNRLSVIVSSWGLIACASKTALLIKVAVFSSGEISSTSGYDESTSLYNSSNSSITLFLASIIALSTYGLGSLKRLVVHLLLPTSEIFHYSLPLSLGVLGGSPGVLHLLGIPNYLAPSFYLIAPCQTVCLPLAQPLL